jgi:hypothetical protein
MRLTAAVLVAILAVLSPQASELASAASNAKGGSFTMSGQENGKLSLNVAETCAGWFGRLSATVVVGLPR